MMRSRLVPALALFIVVGCGRDPAFTDSPHTSLQPVEIVLSPGQEHAVDGVFRVQFERVGEDSRCPIDVTCVWEGNAAVEIGLRLGMGPTQTFTLDSTGERREVVHAGYRVRLVEIGPAQVSTTRIEPQEYRAKLRIEKVQ